MDHAEHLRNKYLGARSEAQKFLGTRPKTHADAMFGSAPPVVNGDHPVPVTNFMNAQCKGPPPTVLSTGCTH